MANSNKENQDNKQNKEHRDREREKEVIQNRKRAEGEAQEADRELTSEERTEMDASHGEDAIEIEQNEGRRFDESNEFSPFTGDLGDESEDLGDLPPAELKNKNFYNSAASVGEDQEGIDPEDAKAMLIKKGRKAGVSYSDKDSYIDDDKKK